MHSVVWISFVPERFESWKHRPHGDNVIGNVSLRDKGCWEVTRLLKELPWEGINTGVGTESHKRGLL